MDDSKLRYFASAWLISITLPADSAERYNAQFVNGIDPLAFNQFVASDGDVMPGTYDVNIYINDLLVDSRPVRFSGNDSNLLIVFYVQIVPDDFVMQLHRF